MQNSGTYVSSKSLIELQSDLNKLSERLMEIYDLINQNISSVHEDWTDNKFDEFNENFKPSNDLIQELSEKYKDWAMNYLPPRIEEAIAYEEFNTDIK